MGRNRHVKKLMGGQMTAEQVHAKYAFPPDAKCNGCGTRSPTVRAIVLMPVKEAMKREEIAMVAEANPQALMDIMVQIVHPDTKTREAFIRVSKAYSCEACRTTLERELAKNLPSYAICEINRGPGPDKVITS